MKKAMSALLAAVLLVSCFAMGAMAVEAGEKVTISFEATGNPGFANYGVQIVYDAAVLELVSIDAGELSGKGFFDGNVGTGKVGYAGTADVTGDGVLFTATFQVKAGAALGTYSVTADLDELSTANLAGDEVTFTVTGGEVEVTCDHAWGEWVVTEEAECTEKGMKERTCSKCGAVETAEIEAAGHEWGEWEVTEEAGCTEAGSQKRTCATCGEVETEEIPAKGHAHGEEWKYDEEGHWHECGCGDKADAAEHEKEWVVTKNPTHKDVGYKHEECKVCEWVGPDVEIPADPSLDDVPGTGDITPLFLAGTLSLLAAAAFVFKRKAAV